MTLLTAEFFARGAGEVAPALVGCTLLVDGAGGEIVEVERYEQWDAASHSHRGPTPRAAVMFGPPGRLYVYRSYGLHWCANVVCGPEGVGSAVLLRALRPTHGLEDIRARRAAGGAARPLPDRLLCAGPGRLCQALGIDARLNGLPAVPGAGSPPVAELHAPPAPVEVVADRRIGIT
ncbi:MAG TPA: DNA-3-methyladenine glycosylase, partial [Miltoncostaeaceae bacterium]|nr:DNA-3-methyladenine glycosylase [Miltoncostaeaceae bacterium]